MAEVRDVKKWTLELILIHDELVVMATSDRRDSLLSSSKTDAWLKRCESESIITFCNAFRKDEEVLQLSLGPETWERHR